MRRSRAVPARSIVAVAGLAVLLPLASGCGLIGPGTTPQEVPESMTVTSPDFGQGMTGSAFSCHGSGKHPVIYWSGAPRGTKSFALVMDDSALQRLIGPLRKTPYVEGVRQTLAAVEPR